MQKDRHFSKIKTICVMFLFTKIQTLYVTQFFMKILKFAFIYIYKARFFALGDVFMYKKLDTPKKAREFSLFFFMEKSGHFALHDFSLNF